MFDPPTPHGRYPKPDCWPDLLAAYRRVGIDEQEADARFEYLVGWRKERPESMKQQRKRGKNRPPVRY